MAGLQNFTVDADFIVPQADTDYTIECWGARGHAIVPYSSAQYNAQPGYVYINGQWVPAPVQPEGSFGSYAKATFSGFALGEVLKVHCNNAGYNVAADVRRGGNALANRIIVAGGAGDYGTVTSYDDRGYPLSVTFMGAPISYGNDGYGGKDATNGADATATAGGAPGLRLTNPVPPSSSSTFTAGVAGTLATGGAGGYAQVGGTGFGYGRSNTGIGGRGGDGLYGGGGGGVSIGRSTDTLYRASSAGAGGRGSSYTGTGSSAIININARNGGSIVKISWGAADRAPYAPKPLSPVDSIRLRLGDDVFFQWLPDDPDPGATMTRWRMEVKLASSGTPAFTRDYSNANTSWMETYASFAVGDWVWRVLTYDQQPLVGPYSDWEPFTIVNPAPSPAITAPANGAVISTGTQLVSWETSYQDVYEMRRVRVSDNTISWSSGTVNEPLTRSAMVTFTENHQAERIEIRTRYDTIWSLWVAVNVTVEFLGPMVPTLVVTPDDIAGHITVAVTNPTPTVGHPVPARQELWVRVAFGRADGQRTLPPLDGVRIAIFTSLAPIYHDAAAASEVEYEYRVRAIGANETSTWSEWTR